MPEANSAWPISPSRLGFVPSTLGIFVVEDTALRQASVTALHSAAEADAVAVGSVDVRTGVGVGVAGVAELVGVGARGVAGTLGRGSWVTTSVPAARVATPARARRLARARRRAPRARIADTVGSSPASSA